MNRFLPIICTLAVSLWSIQPAVAGTRKVCNDFDGDGRTDPAIYYPASGLWSVMLSGSGTITNVILGGGNYLPAPGDYDGVTSIRSGAHPESRARVTGTALQ